MSDEARAEQLVLKYGFDLQTIDKAEIGQRWRRSQIR